VTLVIVSGIAVYFDSPLPYAIAERIQQDLVAARIREEIPDTVLFLEHPPVVTLGNRGRSRFLRTPPDALAEAGIDLAHAARGGDVTYHAPGQLVLYPILKLGTHEADAHGYMHNLEEIAIRTAGDFDVSAWRRAGMNGAWTRAGKIAAIGFRLKRWVTYHGMSFNVHPDLRGFDHIVPCGLTGEKVASLETLLGPECPPIAQVREAMRRRFEEVCARRLEVKGARTEWPGPLKAAVRGEAERGP